MIYRIFKMWVLLAFLAAAMCGLVYLAVQQSLRMGANDPQIQMAEDAATQFQVGPAPQSVMASGTIDINESLSPYFVFYDPSGNPIAGTGILDGSLPNLPAGVFVYTSQHGEDRFTWQPRPGVRQAVVIIRMTDSTHPGFVMAGRSLREVEIREMQALHEAIATWFATVIGILILQLCLDARERRKGK